MHFDVGKKYHAGVPLLVPHLYTRGAPALASPGLDRHAYSSVQRGSPHLDHVFLLTVPKGHRLLAGKHTIVVPRPANAAPLYARQRGDAHRQAGLQQPRDLRDGGAGCCRRGQDALYLKDWSSESVSLFLANVQVCWTGRLVVHRMRKLQHLLQARPRAGPVLPASARSSPAWLGNSLTQ